MLGGALDWGSSNLQGGNGQITQFSARGLFVGKLPIDFEIIFSELLFVTVLICLESFSHFSVGLAPRPAGDPPELVVDPSRAVERLGALPQHSGLRSIVETAWRRLG